MEFLLSEIEDVIKIISKVMFVNFVKCNTLYVSRLEFVDSGCLRTPEGTADLGIVLTMSDANVFFPRVCVSKSES